MSILRRALMCTVLMCAVMQAQETLTHASITGRVLDSSGAVMPRVSVRAVQLSTNQTYTAQTDPQGRFRIPYLPVGDYSVTVAVSGFAPETRHIQLTVGSAFDLALRLGLPQASATVHVAAQPPVIETDRSQLSETVRQAEIKNLPYESRNYLDLALLIPGVSPTNTGSTQTLAETSEVVGQGYSVNSQRNLSNSFIVDGLSANDDAAGVAGNVLGMDVVQEFQVVTSGGQAEFGRAMGGYFNIVTKSGANRRHGAVYGFLRNKRLNTANALSGSKLPLTQGIYGVSLSGPIQRDRTFAFGNFEEGRLNTNGVITVSPTDAAAINSRLTAVGYQAPLLPTGSGPATLYPTTLHTDTVFLRGDHRFGQNDHMEARYNFYQLSSRNARGVGGLNEVSNGTSVFDVNHTIAVSNIVTLSPSIFNETRGQFVYDSLTAPPNDEIGPAVSISGVAIFGRSTSSPTARRNDMFEGVDNLVIQHGANTFKTGIDFLFNRDSITYPQSLRGSYSFSSLVSFQSGAYNSQGFTQNFGSPTVRQNNPNLGLYAQDEWKATSSLTVNLGLRYDLQWLQTINIDVNNLSPRVGLAWSPFANDRTVVRASYGLFYDRVPLRPLANALLSANNTTAPEQAHYFSYTFSPGDSGAPVFPAVAAAPPAASRPNYSLMDRHIQNPVSQQISLAVEQQMTAHTTLGLSYQHLRGEHLISSHNININPDGTRPDPTRGNVKPYSSIFDSYFDGLAVSLVQREGDWGSARVSYMWSKAIDDVGEFFFSSPINNFYPGEDRSRADDDQRHRLVFDATLHTPMKPSQDWGSRIVHGWSLSGILQYYSRLPFNITTGSSTRQGTSERPCAPGYSLGANGGLNPCTEALPGAVIGRNAGIGFDSFNLNVRLMRTFVLRGDWKLQTMAEAFNALNHRNDMVPNGTWGSGSYPSLPKPNFGAATAVADPRSVQLGTRLEF